MDALNRGDAAAFEVLYHRYRDWVLRVAYRFTGNRDDALDVLQETFAYLVKKFPGFSLTARLTTFLYPAIKSFSLSSRRKRRRFTTGESTLEELTASDGKDGKDVESSRAELGAVVAVLPDEQREVLLMRFVDGLSLREIARALDIPLGTVKSRLHKALSKLREDARTRRYFLD